MHLNFEIINRIFLVDQSVQVSPVESKILSFEDLPKGWDYGSGGPTSPRITSIALEWCDRLIDVGFAEIDAFPGGSGEVLIAGSKDNEYVEVIVEQDETISVALEVDGKQLFYKTRLLDHEARALLQEVAEGKWNAFTLSTQENSTLEKSSGPELPSEIIKALSPSSVVSASPHGEAQFVITLGDSIYQSVWWQSPLYSGGSIQIFSPRQGILSLIPNLIHVIGS
jgi:hypothetical protein